MTKIKLSNKSKVANDFRQSVHYFPNYDNFIIKVRLNKTTNENPIHFKTWMYKIFPNAIYRSFFTEIYHELNTQIRADTIGMISPIAPTRGLVDTTLGLGIVMDRIGPKEKKLGPTLSKLSKDGLLNDVKLNALNEFASSLFILKVICADINPDNIVWSEANKRFYIVDGFGDRNFIKIKTLFNFLRIKRINRELLRTAGILNLNWSPETRNFSRM